jgi:DNA polymerase-1
VAYVATAEALPDPATLPAVIGFDLETFNRRTDLWRHLASLHPALGGEIRLAQISTGGDAPTLVVDVAVIGQPAIEWLRAIARDPERTLVGHNLLFDATYLIAAGIRPLCRWWDTMLASQLIGDLPINSLAAVVGHYLGAEVDKAEQTGDWGGQLTASQLAYAAIDARVVLPLREALAAQLEATGQLEVHRLDCQMISPCADGQERGLAVDAAQVEQCRQRAVPEREAKVAELHALLGIANYRSPQQLRPALEQLLDERLPDTTKDTLKPFKAVPGVALLMAVKELDQALKELTWLEQGLSVADGRVRPNYKILGARSGRTTTSALISSTASAVPSDTEVDKAGKPKTVKLGQVGFNFQGLTKVTKGILSTGAPDTVLLDLDWSAIEVRLQASPQLYNDDGQRQILLEGLDPHAHIASQVCGREIAPIGVDESGAKIWPPERSTIGKTANFALSYGCGQARLQRQLSLAQQRPVGPTEAQSVYSAWHRFHPQISRRMAAFDRGSRITEARTLNGRRMTVRGHKAGPDGTLPLLPLSRTNGINLPIQGTGRDLLADALGDLWPALDAYPGVRVVGLIHDEILLEVPTAQLEAVRETALAALTSSRLQQTYLGDIPLEADAKVGKSWGDAH